MKVSELLSALHAEANRRAYIRRLDLSEFLDEVEAVLAELDLP